MTAADRTELADLSDAWMRAVQERDAEALERLVGDGFRFTAVHLGPEPMNREQWMETALAGYTIVSFSFLEMDVDVHHDTAVVHSRYSQIANLGMTDLSNVFRLTDVWSRESGGPWQVVARHSSILG